MSNWTRFHAGLLLALAATPAMAAPPGILATSIDSTVTTYTGGPPYQLQLDNSGGTSLTFKTSKANETVIVTTQVSCYAIGSAYLVQFNGHTSVDGVGEADFGSYGCNAPPQTSGVTITTSSNAVFTVKTPGTHTATVSINSAAGAAFVVYSVVSTVTH